MLDAKVGGAHIPGVRNDARERVGVERAVVIGGSMAGLVAARVLSVHFNHVVVVERDELSDAPEARKGVPQAKHLHVLLARGLEILNELFPGFDTDLAAGGAEMLDVARDFAWYHYGVWKKRFESGIVFSAQSRPLLESCVRRRVRQNPTIEIQDGHVVEGLITTEDARRALGVRMQGGQEISADLVVDASGRGSRTPHWLEAMGYPRPPEEVVKVHVGYASRLYKQTDPAKRSWKSLYVLGTPPIHRRIGVITPIEGGRWIVSLGGNTGDYPPSDEEGFLDFAKSLASDELYLTLLESEPLTPIASYRFPSHKWHRYDKLRDFPEGFVVFGDALCSFNPIYGQGMTTAAASALVLDECIRARLQAYGDLRGLSRHFQEAVVPVVKVPWDLATREDLRFPQVEGHRPASLRFFHWYGEHLQRAAGYDEKVARVFFTVNNLLAPPSVLFQPSFVARVLGDEIRAHAR